MKKRSYRWLFIVLALIGFLGDQGSKYGVFRWLAGDGQRGSQEVVEGWFRFLAEVDPSAEVCDCPLVRMNGPVPPRVNHGALFGLGGEHKQTANSFFAGVSIFAALAILIWATRKATRHDGLLCASLGMILGGTLGNLFDRLFFGGVRDFMYFYRIEWPVFNFADCCLVCGAALLLFQAIWFQPKEDLENPV